MNVLEQAQELVALASPSQQSNHQVSQCVQARLQSLGFEIERVEYVDAAGVSKVSLVGRKGPPVPSDGQRGLAYFSHSDVVPAETWSGPSEGPFLPTVHDNRLYGRGSCDMKGSIACMLGALQRLGAAKLSAPCYFVCTADEEVGYRGAREVVARSRYFQEMAQHQTRVLIGEPTRLEVVHAHKGICQFCVTSRGEAAHSSTRQGRNANLAMIPFLQEMKDIHDQTESQSQWQNDEFDPPTLSWNIGINDYNLAMNIKPARSVCRVFFRPLPGVDDDVLLRRTSDLAAGHGLTFCMEKRSEAVYTDPTIPFVKEALELAGRSVPQTVSYGTDGGELAKLPDKIVCGPGDIAQAHTSDEWIELEQLNAGTILFEKFLRQWCFWEHEPALGESSAADDL